LEKKIRKGEKGDEITRFDGTCLLPQLLKIVIVYYVFPLPSQEVFSKLEEQVQVDSVTGTYSISCFS
jgi:hypothetical protein